MPHITEERIRELAGFRADAAPVVTVYLDMDGRRTPKYADVEARADRLLRRPIERYAGNGQPSVADDLRRVQQRLKEGFDRSRTRGVAVFASGPAGLWEVVELPVPVRDQVVVNATPHVRQLELVVDQSERFGVLLADRQRARMFVFEQGELIDRSELFEQLPRGDDEAGGRDRGADRHHREVAAHAHLRHAADVAWRVYQERDFDHLIIGAPEDIANELQRDLHRYLQERVVARLSVPVASSEATICEEALKVEAEVERRKEAALVERLRDAVGAGRGGVAGLEPVLRALGERRVDVLLVSDDFEAPGWHCPSCRHLATRVAAGRGCPMCGEEMVLSDDIIEEAVEEALLQSCKVQTCSGNADLDVLGRVGALLRF